MRALILLSSVSLLALAYALGSFSGLLIAALLSIVIGALSFVFSTASTEARESRAMQRAMGRNTTFLAKLGKR